MCFSIQIDNNIKKLSQIFKAQISDQGPRELARLMMLQEQMEQKEFKKELGIKSKNDSRPLKLVNPDDEKVFQNYFTNILVRPEKINQRIFTPMRYRVRPMHSKEEVPQKYNVYNARLDSLETRNTWIPLFGKKHGIIPMKKFYEWVADPKDETKSRLISFRPKDKELMWAPCLYDEWISCSGKIYFRSFAIITTNPHRDVLSMGHDRTPVFLKESVIDEWLMPSNKTKKELYSILEQEEVTSYAYEFEY